MRYLGCLLLLGLISAGAPAEAVVIGATDSGWYESGGIHLPANTNYLAGACSSCPNDFHRNFFVFDLSGVSAPIAAATLRLFNPDYTSPNATETYAVFDVSTPIASLVAGTGGIAAYADLGTGVSFGSVVVSDADDGSVVEISLNAAGLAAFNGALGGQFAIGGAVTTLSGAVVDEYVFGFSSSTGVQELDVTPVPEPASLVLVGSGLFALGLRRRRRP